jgi:DNA polymerase V
LSNTLPETEVPLRTPQDSSRVVVAYLNARRARRPLAADTARAVDVRRAVFASPLRVRRFDAHVPAGFPSPADDYVEDHIDLNAHLIQQGHEAATFIVRASGWSMIGAGIHDGDEIIVDRALEAKNGDVVVAAVSGELVIKRLRFRGEKIVLVSDNPHYPERVIAEGEQLEIWGVATRVLHKL